QFMVLQDTQSNSGVKHPDDPGEAENVVYRKPVALGEGKADLVLPATDTKRWSSRRKAAVVVATRTGVLTREEACERYHLSSEELTGWERAFDRRGIPGLRISSLRHYRPPTLSNREEGVLPRSTQNPR